MEKLVRNWSKYQNPSKCHLNIHRIATHQGRLPIGITLKNNKITNKK